MVVKPEPIGRICHPWLLGYLDTGMFTVVEMPLASKSHDPKLIKNSLLYQPRVLSTKRGLTHSYINIFFKLLQLSQVTVKIYDVAGRLAELIEKTKLWEKATSSSLEREK